MAHMNTYVLTFPVNSGNTYQSYQSNDSYDSIDQRMNRLFSGNQSYQNDYAKTAFYQSLCNNGNSYNSGNNQRVNDSSWCSNGIF